MQLKMHVVMKAIIGHKGIHDQEQIILESLQQ
jgi:hypothetical protein